MKSGGSARGRPEKVADDIQVAIEHHCSPMGRSRIDVLLGRPQHSQT